MGMAWHTLRHPLDNITRKAISWNPQLSRCMGRTSHTWKHQITTELSKLSLLWNKVDQTLTIELILTNLLRRSKRNIYIHT